MTRPVRFASWRALLIALSVLALTATACGDDTAVSGADSSASPVVSGTLRIGAIPDQDPDLLLRNHDLLTDHIEAAVPGLTVEFSPVSDYVGAVSGFRVGDLDLVWFGGLTGVQARLEVPGAVAVAQRDIDAHFTSVFIARVDAGIEPITDVAGLDVLAGRSLAFGSESSTSGRLMPQFFLAEAGLDIEASFDGPVGFSGSHDNTIAVVDAGSYEVGALNSQVWDARVASGDVDTAEVVELFRTPEYYDYHWVARPDVDERLGEGTLDQVVAAILALDAADPAEAVILDFFGAASFVETVDANYDAIEAVGREIGAIR